MPGIFGVVRHVENISNSLASEMLSRLKHSDNWFETKCLYH